MSRGSIGLHTNFDWKRVTNQIQLQTDARSSRARIPGPLGINIDRDGKFSVPQHMSNTSIRGPIGLSLLFESFQCGYYMDKTINITNQVPETIEVGNELTFADKISNWRSYFKDPVDKNISRKLWENALTSLLNHFENSKLVLPHIVTLVNFDMNSNEKRLWVINLLDKTVLFNVVTSHGSGVVNSSRHNSRDSCNFVGNQHKCLLSSVGAYATALTQKTTTAGSRGHKTIRIALAVHGLDPTNNLAFDRKILFHGAYYVNHNSAGRSNGCFATEELVNNKIVPVISGGSFVYAYKNK